jgi:S1/P1 Nuclease
MKRFWLATWFALVPLHQAFPWGQEGHSIVAEIAQRRLTPDTLGKIDKLFWTELPNPKESQFSLASIASWADDYRSGSYGIKKHTESSNWHFVDIPYSADTYDEARDCKLDPTYGDCIIHALAQFTATLADCSRSPDDRMMALKFIVHLMGDLHQPLHVTTRINPDSNRDDHGGNLIPVAVWDMQSGAYKSTNLHHTWDTDLILNKVWDWGDYVRILETKWLIGQDIAALQAGNHITWAQESHRLAQTVVYNFRPDHILDQEYIKDALYVVDRQLAVAGLRLARVLNETLQRAQCK